MVADHLGDGVVERVHRIRVGELAQTDKNIKRTNASRYRSKSPGRDSLQDWLEEPQEPLARSRSL